jgi:hypothetical protein
MLDWRADRVKMLAPRQVSFSEIELKPTKIHIYGWSLSRIVGAFSLSKLTEFAVETIGAAHAAVEIFANSLG